MTGHEVFASGWLDDATQKVWGRPVDVLVMPDGSLLVSDDYYEYRTPTGGGLNKLGTLLGNAEEILAQKAGAFINRRSNEGIYVRAAECFVEAIRGNISLHAASWDAVRVHRALAAIRESIEQGCPVASAEPYLHPGKATA